MEQGFEKANSNNMPGVDVLMIADFLKENECFNQAESSGTKADRSTRESYGDAAVGYVQVSRNGSKCTAKCKICPEHRVRNKGYSVSVVVDEEAEHIDHIECHDCAASLGGCKHALAFLMWLHRRSEEPAPTSVACYWKKARLAKVGSSLKFLQVKDLGSSDRRVNLPNKQGFLDEVVSMAKEIDYLCPLLQHTSCTVGSRSLSIHQMLIEFIRGGGVVADDFINFICNKAEPSLLKGTALVTKDQSNIPLWHELRYGRITASKLYEAARCKTADGSLVHKIIGAAKVWKTTAMKRGLQLEPEVLLEIENKIKQKIDRSGFIIIPTNPILGASPDGVTKNFVVEIKCPASEKAVKQYIVNGEITKKVAAQVQMQMLAAQKQQGLFCVASPDFEKTRRIELIWMDFDEKFVTDLNHAAVSFWKDNVYPLLYNSVI